MGRDRTETSEIAAHALPLAARTAGEVLLDDDDRGSVRPPGPEVGRKSRAETGDYGRLSRSRDMHRAAVRPDEKRGAPDHEFELREAKPAGQRENRPRRRPQNPSFGLLIGLRADKHGLHPGERRKKPEERSKLIDSPVPEPVSGANMEHDELRPFGFRFFEERPDPRRLFLARIGNDKRRNIGLLEIETQGTDEIGVVFDAVDGTLLVSPGDPDVVEKFPVFDLVADLGPRSAEKADPGGSRPAMKIEEDIVSFPPEFAEEGDKLKQLLLRRNGNHPGEVRIPLDEPPPGFLDDVGQGSVGEIFLEKGHGGRRHDDIADAP